MQKTIHYRGQDIRYVLLQPTRPSNSGSDRADLTLMLVHGFPERGGIFQEQLDALSAYYTLLVPDLPGSGGSPYNPVLESTADFADSLAAIIKEEQIDKLVIIGHSMGGYIALAFAERYPEIILGLGLLHSTAYADSEQKKVNRIKAIHTMEQYGGAAFLKTMIPTLFGPVFKSAHPQVIQELIEAGSHFETRTLQQYYQMMHDRTDKTALLMHLSIPFLFISGTEDKAAPAIDLIRQSSLPQTAMIEILEQAGHMGFLECPGQVNKILTHFLQLVQNVSI
ncbi:alpha/beta fold hydrolase [Arachidicoccus terrestris]|uniref:alpha/beta fold hydrolase n=1 Tax=Arachidicoccus terrestris TaxID=2875539 RepID=UPI001CC52A2C|nr:alpha/beta hydrolase [Arachidicoccus terrestris]UAY54423.1 alpha/beta hydrolase [Arachidicoccus terrestris]